MTKRPKHSACTQTKLACVGAQALYLLLTTSGCADDDSTPAAGNTAGSSGSAAIPELNGCAETAYEDHSAAADSRTIAIAAAGLTYTPKCMTIAAGQQVRWEGSLSAHPLAPGNPQDDKSGSPDSPIQATGAGSSVEFTFSKAGTYPYYCTVHGYGTGQGMVGVVHVR